MNIPEALRIFTTRQSIKPVWMGNDAPDEATLMGLLQCAMSAPDHGGLKPWRFHIIQGDDRNKLGAMMRDRYQQLHTDADDDELDNIASKPLRAPLIVVVGAKIRTNLAKIPPQEQISTVSMAAANILSAAHLTNIGAIMLSGWSCFDPIIKQAFGYSDTDAIIGYIYMGNIANAPGHLPKRSKVKEFTTIWNGA